MPNEGIQQISLLGFSSEHVACVLILTETSAMYSKSHYFEL